MYASDGAMQRSDKHADEAPNFPPQKRRSRGSYLDVKPTESEFPKPKRQHNSQGTTGVQEAERIRLHILPVWKHEALLRKNEKQVATVASPGPVSPGSPGSKSTPRVGTPPLRRSNRVRNPPCRLGDFVSHAQTAHLLDWQIKVAALMQLLPLFPLQHAEIGNAIMYVITHA